MKRVVLLLCLTSPLACTSGGSNDDDAGFVDAGAASLDVTGTWVGSTTYTASAACGGTRTDALTLDLTQNGSSITGTAHGATITGTVNGDAVNLVPDINCGSGQAQPNFACTASTSGNVLNCTVSGELCEGCSSDADGGNSSNQPAPVSNASATFTKQ